MKKLLKLLLILSVLITAFPSSQAQAAPPPPDHPWLSEVIEADDLNVSEGISIARLPGTNTLVVAYTGERPSLNHRILKFAIQVQKGTGNCGIPKDWYCMEVDNTPFAGWSPSIAVVQDPKNRDLVRIGISYMDMFELTLKYANNVYDKKTAQLTGSWQVETIDGPTPIIYRAAWVNSLTFDPQTGKPVIAYDTLEADLLGNPMNKGWLNTTTYVGAGNGNCGVSNSWNCVQITTDLTLKAFTHIGLGWIDSKLYYFYTSQNGLSYATLAPGMSCHNPDYYCEVIDNTNTVVGEDLKVSSWSGNLPGTPGYNPLVRENGVNIVYKDEPNNLIKFATTPKTGPLFKVSDIASYGTADVSSLSVSTDANYFAAATFSSPSYYGNDIVLARPAAAYGMLFGDGCGFTMGTWVCDVALTAERYSKPGELAAIDVNGGNLVSIVHNQYYPIRDFHGLQILRQEDYKMGLPLIRR